MPVHPIHFTLAEAQTALHHVRPIIEEVVELKRKLDQKGYDPYKHQYFGGLGPNGQKVFPDEMERIVSLVRELDKLGIQVKSLDLGLIDFPHLRRNGEEVYLCYQVGEEAIGYWHSLEEGFSGRRELSEL